MTYRTPSVLAVAASLALTISACSGATAPEPVEASAFQATEWPRTIELPAGQGGAASTLTVEAEPQRIAALDYESAEVLAALGLSERLVLVPEAVLNPVLGGHIEELAEIEATFPVAMEVEAETVISLAPDLVIMSPRHGNEVRISTVLRQAGIATLQLPTSWVSPDALLTNIDLIGQASGSESQAAGLAAELEGGLAEGAVGSPSNDSPRVLVLTNQAGQPFVTAGAAYPIELLALAGARNAAAEIGIDRTGPITAEQIVQLNPDGIVLIDMNGSGDRMFTELLTNPAVAAIPAVAGERALRIEGRRVQALGLTETIDGLSTLASWVHSLASTPE